MLAIRFPNLDAAIHAAVRRLQSEQPQLLTELGSDLLDLARQDYQTKARGGAGSDGTTWAKLTRATIEARVRSRAPAKQIVAQRKQLAAQIKATKGPGATKRIEAFRKQRAELEAKLQAMIDQEMARHEIGVNTGLQRASAEAELFAEGVAIEYGRAYSPFFDEKRPLLPDVLPTPWLTAFERRTVEWGTTVLAETIGS